MSIRTYYLIVWLLWLSFLCTGSKLEIKWYLCKAQLSEIQNIVDPLLFSNPKPKCRKINRIGTVLSILLEPNASTTISPENSDIYSFQNFRRIPDISTMGKSFYTYWYIGFFRSYPINTNKDSGNSKSSSKCNKVFMHFNGINYRPEFYVNAQRVYDMTYQTSVGMFRRYSLDITDYIHSTSSDAHGISSTNTYQHSVPNSTLLPHIPNTISVLVHPPDYPGSVPATGGQGGDHEIAKNGAIMQCTAGWDWIQATPDRNTVSVSVSVSV